MDASPAEVEHRTRRHPALRGAAQRLGDMLDSMDLIDAHIPGDRPAYDSVVVMRYFLLKQVEIIGEAAFKLSSDFKDHHPGIPWSKIEKTRHILVHDYFDVDWDILWDILNLHLRPLRAQLEQLVHDCGES